ncbi:Serine/threonine-protein kinase prk-2 [Triplophysa tibetana]|uniref:non-specific serine/threonine protein kinase n=1 Tax=Triplophysa tibetana TaxID=1572043 RepID=A0A5A9PFC7_9TELE|nr:Serine/threonine-protein kinase prk-2 [Triplophysa tibetana]
MWPSKLNHVSPTEEHFLKLTLRFFREQYVSSGSDAESVDSFRSAVCSVWGLLENNEDGNVIYEINSCQYKTGQILSKGEYGSVYEATRVSDDLKVAVKIVRPLSPDFVSIPGHPNFLHREIALHILASEGHVPEIIRLLDWEERNSKYVMVLENPSPCMDLFTFIQSRGGKIPENLARIIMRQAVKALIECTMDYWCPEWIETGWYHAFPATVWKLGLMSYKLLCGNLPDTDTRKQIRNKKWRKDDLTKEFCRFINTSLQEDPHQRIQIKNILLHEWFQV